MKKSTILLLVVVYIISFFIIGLLGNAIKNYNPIIDPESIEVIDIDNKMTMYTDHEVVEEKDGVQVKTLYNYWFVFKNYKPNDTVRLKAEVKPDNCSFPDAFFYKDRTNDTFALTTNEEDKNIEKGQALISFTEGNEPTAKEPIKAVRFNVSSTDPDTQIDLVVGITFTIYS